MKLIIAFTLLASVASAQDVPALVVPVEVIDVLDGDTLTVRVTLDIRVRLLDCWAAEVRTKDHEEKAAGNYSRETLSWLCLGEKCLLTVPLAGHDRLDDVFTFGRLLARIRVLSSDLDVSEEMIRRNVATKEK